MTRAEYERAKARIEAEHRAAAELLESARKAQLRALDLVWMVQGEEAGAGQDAASTSAPSAPPPEPPRRKTSPELAEEILAAFWQLPERFTRHDVCEVLGYVPERATLHRSLTSLVAMGHFRVEQAGTGHRAALYLRIPKKPAAAT